jgi:hypothetical protein
MPVLGLQFTDTVRIDELIDIGLQIEDPRAYPNEGTSGPIGTLALDRAGRAAPIFRILAFSSQPVGSVVLCHGHLVCRH